MNDRELQSRLGRTDAESPPPPAHRAITTESLQRALVWRRNRNACIAIAAVLVGCMVFSTLRAAGTPHADEFAGPSLTTTIPQLSLDALRRELDGLEQLLSVPVDLHPRSDELAVLRERAAVAELKFVRSIARQRPDLARQSRADLRRRYAGTAALRIFDEE